MLDIKYCSGCHDDYYNSSVGSNGKCWSRKTGKVVWRIGIGYWENPPYKHKKKVKVADCWRGEGSNRTVYISPESLRADGCWKGDV